MEAETHSRLCGIEGIPLAQVLIFAGLAMNVLGIVLGSSRDLVHVLREASRRSANRLRVWMSRFVLWWRRVIVRHQKLEIHDAKCDVTFSVGFTADGYAWQSVPDDVGPEQMIAALVSRTDTLHRLADSERESRRADVASVHGQLDEFSQSLADSVSRIHERIDDIDVRPAGQRALGAVLVVCGTVLMFIGGLLAPHA